MELCLYVTLLLVLLTHQGMTSCGRGPLMSKGNKPVLVIGQFERVQVILELHSTKVKLLKHVLVVFLVSV